MCIHADPSSQLDQQPLPAAKPISFTKWVGALIMKQVSNTFATREKAVLSKAIAVHTAVHITYVWVDRLQLTSICVSRLHHGGSCLT
jgi:hypothetical protein